MAVLADKPGMVDFYDRTIAAMYADNETLEECLKREILEELGITISVGRLISSRKHIINCQTAIVLYAYQAEYISGDISLTDHDEIAWVKPEDLPGYSFPDPDRQIVRELLKE